jgi:hypothetical protein
LNGSASLVHRRLDIGCALNLKAGAISVIYVAIIPARTEDAGG